ncbi:Calcineurin-like phosphoesterase domain, ApaH type, partial [Dillenia turbinata]
MLSDADADPSPPPLTSSASSSVDNPPCAPPCPSPVTWPSDGKLSVEWIEGLMFTFDWCSRNLAPSGFATMFPVSVFDSLVLSASKILHKEPNCVRINPCNDSRVVVVGDLHGQLHDLLFLLKDAGFPSYNRCFVFNGDYVDRGAWGLETFLLLLSWKVFMPQIVYLLRGNHESKYCTSVYGFEKEVMIKYGDQGKHVYRKCLGCFEGLPLASIIAGQVYTAHGGLFRSVTIVPQKRSKGKRNRRTSLNPKSNSLALGSLEELAKARRSVLDPPWEGSNLIPGDVLWSDPSMSPGLSPNKERGIGLLWGPDCTEYFLKKFQLKSRVQGIFSHFILNFTKSTSAPCGQFHLFTAIRHICWPCPTNRTSVKGKEKLQLAVPRVLWCGNVDDSSEKGDANSEMDVIIAFDIAVEECQFREVPKPNHLAYFVNYQLGVFDGWLRLSEYFHEEDIDIWVMKGYGGSKLIIRSHEGPDAREKRPGLAGMGEGFTIDHIVESGKLITLFSAPDYPQFQ